MMLSVHCRVGILRMLLAKLLNIKYEFYRFSGDLIETITNEYQCGKVISVEVITGFVVMCIDSR